MIICSEQKVKIQEMEDAASAPLAGTQMKCEDVEAAYAKDLEQSILGRLMI